MLSRQEIIEWYQDWFVEGGVKKYRDEVLEEAAKVAESNKQWRYSGIAGAIRALKDKT